MTPVERLQNHAGGLGLTAIDARLETLLESASKKEAVLCAISCSK